MRISITGATGFLGNATSKRLTAMGHHVISWVRDPSLLPKQDARPFDLLNPQAIDLRDTDMLIHCAAHLPASYEDPNEVTKCMMDNGVATLELLNKAESAGIKKFVYISSGTIYDPSLTIAKETDPIYPSMRATYYLTSKVVGDIFADHCRQTFKKTRVITLRPSSIYGPNMKPKGLLPRLVQKINDGYLTSKDVGNYPIDLVHVDDAAWMVAQTVVNGAMAGTFNVGGGLTTNTLQVAKILAHLLNKPMPPINPPKSNGHAILDISRAREVGYKPRSLVDGLYSYVESLYG